jgi:hypothetical protein
MVGEGIPMRRCNRVYHGFEGEMPIDSIGSEASERLSAAAAALRAAVHLYGVMGTPLYATLCARAASDADIVALVSRGKEGAAPMHLFSSVHYLLLRDPSDPLSRFFATLTPRPERPEDAFPEFARFCRDHRQQILELLDTRTVQTTYVERCSTLMPLLSRVADETGEPLNLVEIGCSAGVLLTFDKYAYELERRGRLGAADAPLTLSLAVIGGRPLHIPRIGARVGLDLHVVDASSEDERRWLLALSFPEHREQQAALAAALKVVARTPIRMIEGDALDTLPSVLADIPEPLCVFHSACLMYWPSQAKAALDALLVDASRNRSIYRVAMEPTDRFTSEQKGRTHGSEPTGQGTPISGEAIITRYHCGVVDRIAAARTAPHYGSVEWIA